MKAKPYRLAATEYTPCEPSEATHVELHMPGPLDFRMIPVGPGLEPRWDWSGDTESPTLSPSILTRGGRSHICHSFVRNGKVEFLSDCTHEFAGQTVDLLEVE